MRHLKWILLGMLALPTAEIVIFVAIAARIGPLATIVLAFATSAAGLSVLRSSGAARIPHVNGMIGAVAVNPGKLLAGLLLAIPGFLTDLAGALLLVPAIRRWAAKTIISGKIVRGGPATDVLDLGPGEWRRLREDMLASGVRPRGEP